MRHKNCRRQVSARISSIVILIPPARSLRLWTAGILVADRSAARPRQLRYISVPSRPSPSWPRLRSAPPNAPAPRRNRPAPGLAFLPCSEPRVVIDCPAHVLPRCPFRPAPRAEPRSTTGACALRHSALIRKKVQQLSRQLSGVGNLRTHARPRVRKTPRSPFAF